MKLEGIKHSWESVEDNAILKGCQGRSTKDNPFFLGVASVDR